MCAPPLDRSEDGARFFHGVMHAAKVSPQTKGKAVTVHITSEVSRALRQTIGRDEPFTGVFDVPLKEDDVISVALLRSLTVSRAGRSIRRSIRLPATRSLWRRDAESSPPPLSLSNKSPRPAGRQRDDWS
jgi:hypothetical protein